jgi:hypothetical protein
MTSLRFLALGLAFGCLAGCGDQRPKFAPVSGKVTFNNAPLADGVVLFTRDGEVPQEIPIANGSFQGRAMVGKNRVQFAAYKQVPIGRVKVQGPGAEEVSRENLLPPRYHQESTEFREVTEKGPNEFTFDLKSK